MIRHSSRAETKTGGRGAATRQIPPRLALAVGLPSTPAPTGWQWRQLSDLARLESGDTPSRRHPEYWGGAVPWISIRDAKAHHGGSIDETEETINDLGLANSSARLIPRGAVCLSRTASVGYVVVTRRPMATSQDFVNWICGPDLEPRFLQYLFLAEGDDLLRFASGAVHQTIYFPEAKAFTVSVPGIEMQQRIVAILDEAFEGIATAKANAEKNLENARELFSRQLDDVFLRSQAGWVASTLGGTYDVRDGTHDSPKYHDSGVPLITSKNLKRDGLSFEDIRFISDADYRKIGERSGVHKGDVLFAMIGTIGNPTVVEVEPAFAIKNVALFKMPPGQSGHFLRYYLTSQFVVRKVQVEAKGTTQKFVGLGYLREFPIRVPGEREQLEVVRELDELVGETDRLEHVYGQKLAVLDDLKKSLLHQAFTGALIGSLA